MAVLFIFRVYQHTPKASGLARRRRPVDVVDGRKAKSKAKVNCISGGRRLIGASLATILLALSVATTQRSAAQACQQVALRNGIVCNCTDSYCDAELLFEWPADDTNMLKMVSDDTGARFQLSSVAIGPPKNGTTGQQPARDGVHFRVMLDINRRYQELAGYGGAFTDSASMLIKDKLSAKSREQLMRGYFAPTGLNYNLARVPIGGTDMSWRPYSYDDMAKGEEDFDLAAFRLQPEDLDYKLPLIRWAQSLRPTNRPLRLLASSWSAPNWMKSNNKLVQGRIKDDADAATTETPPTTEAGHATRGQHQHQHQNRIDGKYYDAYARYLIRFLDEYERELSANASAPFKIWALTPQNEPCTPGRLGLKVVNYNSVNFTPAQIGRFVSAHLVPNLLRSSRTSRDMALFVWDDTLVGLDKYKDHLFRLASRERRMQASKATRRKETGHETNELDDDDGDDDQLKEDILADEYIRGMAIHWYSQGLDKLPYKALYELRRWLPARFSLISTEASFIGEPQPGNWSRGERYARDIIMNLRAGSLGWIDWNLALNVEGGPTWSENFLDAAVLVDEQSGSYVKSPMYYAIGHLSRFIQAGSRIVESQVMAAAEAPAERGQNGTGAAAWRPVDEQAEQTSELLVVASEQAYEPQPPDAAVGKIWRRIALVLLNRASSKRRVALSAINCRSRAFDRAPPAAGSQLELELNAKSITSLAFNC